MMVIIQFSFNNNASSSSNENKSLVKFSCNCGLSVVLYSEDAHSYAVKGSNQTDTCHTNSSRRTCSHK